MFNKYFADEANFILSVWSGSYVCADNGLNISYILNVSKAQDSTIGTTAVMTIRGTSLPMTGTYASFAKVLALQSHQVVTQNIIGNNFTEVEINMNFISSLFMKGGIVFRSENDKQCQSELRRIAGRC